MNALTIGSLFSGIGGLELGLERAGSSPATPLPGEVQRDRSRAHPRERPGGDSGGSVTPFLSGIAAFLDLPLDVSADGLGEAIFSHDRRYRYALVRHAPPAMSTGLSGTALWCGLNPSSAGADRDDPTVCRERRRTFETWGCARYVKVNRFALVSTDPKALTKEADPEGWANETMLRTLAERADVIVAAWGAFGGTETRTPALLMSDGRADRMVHLGRTRGGHPRHPLYLPNDTPARRWSDDTIVAIRGGEIAEARA